MKEKPTMVQSVILRPLADLHPNPKNPRRQGPDGIEKLAESIRENPAFFEARPILLSNRTGELVIIGGERRSEAARFLGMTEVPTILIEGLTEEKEDEILVRDNTHSGVWDEVKLEHWGKDELDKWECRGIAWPKKQNTIKEDDFDFEKANKKKVKCKKGDIYQLGQHRLMCGDSSDSEQVVILMGGGEIKANMVFTDPPYGVSIGDKNKTLQRIQEAGRITENIQNDTLSVPDLYVLLKKCFVNVRSNCKEDASYFVTAPPGGDMGLMMMMMKDAGLEVRHQIVWNKDSATFSLGRLDYDYKHEAIMYTWTKSHHNYRAGKFRTSVWDIPKPRKCDLHPTMKPVELVANCILDGSQEGDVILDIFGGSGTTIISAEQLGRKCYMMEIDPHYCDVIIDRWEKFTGQKAILINPGRQ